MLENLIAGPTPYWREPFPGFRHVAQLKQCSETSYCRMALLLSHALIHYSAPEKSSCIPTAAQRNMQTQTCAALTESKCKGTEQKRSKKKALQIIKPKYNAKWAFAVYLRHQKNKHNMMRSTNTHTNKNTALFCQCCWPAWCMKMFFPNDSVMTATYVLTIVDLFPGF